MDEMDNLLKAALIKNESEEARKEVEIALFALSSIDDYYKIEKKLYLEEMKEIIQYHQNNRNLSCLAYQSAWQFLIYRLLNDRHLEDNIVDATHFVREAARELKELTKCVDWKRKEEVTKRKKEQKAIMRWICTIKEPFREFDLWNEDVVGLICSIVELCRAARENEGGTFDNCISLFYSMATMLSVNVDALLEGGAFDLLMEEIQGLSFEDSFVWCYLGIFMEISKRLKEKTNGAIVKRERKASKERLCEKLEEEGYEDIITSFREIIDFIDLGFHNLSLEISDYFIYS
eukprot:MONOS_12386.1-p1 / transcript=MONOS_12386.1 / gene=MONOS_12386 / organism=Monocercomonoides_exilis_PA203 / gene_product=unspecified product / transcript_product=unspecified product / location=Mono_scaffold00682:11407-12650(+) / protein_length=290 / sequence_SO=supercontig / SO=protein_coding / is_pseudo=false